MLNKIVSEIAKKEGKKHQAPIGDVREIVSLVIKACAEDVNVHDFFNKKIEAIADKKGGYNHESQLVLKKTKKKVAKKK